MPIEEEERDEDPEEGPRQDTQPMEPKTRIRPGVCFPPALEALSIYG